MHMVWKRLILKISLGALLALLPVWAAAATTADPITRVEDHFERMKSMKADFVQTSDTGAVSRGKLTLAQPGRIRFQYDAKYPLLVVSNGQYLSVVDYEVAQVSRWPIKDTPLGLLLTPQETLRTRAKVLTGPSIPKGAIVLEGQDTKHPEYGNITLYFTESASGPGGLILEGWRVLDPQGRSTLVQLSNQQWNVPVNPASFQFRDPRPSRRGPPGKNG